MSNYKYAQQQDAKLNTHVSDFGPRFVKVEATGPQSNEELHAIAAGLAAEHFAKVYPGLAYTVDRGLAGAYGGSLIFGVSDTFRVDGGAFVLAYK